MLQALFRFVHCQGRRYLSGDSSAFPIDRGFSPRSGFLPFMDFAQERLIAPEAVPDSLLGDAIVLLYKGIVASAGESARG